MIDEVINVCQWNWHWIRRGLGHMPSRVGGLGDRHRDLGDLPLRALT
jgi:hypothetical protein